MFIIKTRSNSSYSVFIQCCPFSRNGRIYPIPSAIAHTPSLHLSQGILLLQTNLLCFLCHLPLPGLLWSSLLSLATHFKIQSNPQNTIVIPSQHMSIPSNSFAVANQSIVSFNPNMSICSSVVFLSTTF